MDRKISSGSHLYMVPTAWKSSNIAPIPKPQSFNYNMENTRPIALLDTIRKATTKIFTNRLSSLLSRHHILKGYNFCGLKNEDTSIPLYTLNNIIEDARETGKELWLTTQDMWKAYDSISLEGLKLAMN